MMLFDYKLIHKIRRNEKIVGDLVKTIGKMEKHNYGDDYLTNTALLRIIHETQKLNNYNGDLIRDFQTNVKIVNDELKEVWGVNKIQFFRILWINILQLIKGFLF